MGKTKDSCDPFYTWPASPRKDEMMVARHEEGKPRRTFEAFINDRSRPTRPKHEYSAFINYCMSRGYSLSGTIWLPYQPSIAEAKKTLSGISVTAWPLLSMLVCPALEALAEIPSEEFLQIVPPLVTHGVDYFEEEHGIASSAFEDRGIFVQGYLNRYPQKPPFHRQWIIGFSCNGDGVSLGTFLHDFKTKVDALLWANIMVPKFAKILGQISPSVAESVVAE